MLAGPARGVQAGPALVPPDAQDGSRGKESADDAPDLVPSFAPTRTGQTPTRPVALAPPGSRLSSPAAPAVWPARRR